MNKDQGNEKYIIASIIQDLYKNIGMILSLALSIAFLVFIGAKFNYHPTYTSTATFVVSAKTGVNTAYVNLTKTKEMIGPFSTVMDSQILRKKVAEELNMDTFPGTVKVEAVPETNLVTMSVSSGKPEESLRMLKALLKVYPEVGEKVLGEVALNMFENPHYPAEPDRKFSGLSILAEVFAIALIVLIGIVAVISYLQDNVKSEIEVTSKLDTSLFGVIYREKKYKSLKAFLKKEEKRILLTDPSVSFLYDETVKKICTKLLYKLKKDDAKMILVTSTVDGEGKSTVSMNLAQAMANRGRKVLLIEGDLKNIGLAKCMRIDQKDILSWKNCLKEGVDLAEAIYRPKQYAFDVMLNNGVSADAAETLTSKDTVNSIYSLKEKYDVVIIDGPPSKVRADAAVWAQIVDESILVVKENMVETKYINDTIDMLNEYSGNLIGCILNEALKVNEVSSYNYSSYGSYGSYGRYGKYGKYGNYGKYKKAEEDNIDDEGV